MLRSALLTATLLLLPLSLVGQEPDWTVEGEVGGSVFFGNRSQTVFATRGLLERIDPSVETSSEVGFTYGQTTDEEGVTSIHRRSWDAGSDLSFRPEERWNPFLSGRIESSLERRIDLRYNTGGGMRVTLRRDERTRIELSSSVLVERTFPREDPEGLEPVETETLARWSNRLRIQRSMAGGRVEFNSENSYRPAFGELEDFTFRSRNTLSLEVTDAVLLRLTFLDEYDAGAVARGARTNNDGQLQVSLVAQL